MDHGGRGEQVDVDMHGKSGATHVLLARTQGEVGIRGLSPASVAGFAVSLMLLAFLFRAELANLLRIWLEREEYSHGVMLPLLSGYLIWQRRHELSTTPVRPSYLGVGVVVAGIGGLFLSRLAAVYELGQYAFLVAVFGAIVAALGGGWARKLAFPLAIPALGVPLPEFLYDSLSLKLQLISSWLGVEIIRWAGVSVYLEGNVIDLGDFQLQVVDACSGLRYLFPLMAIAFIAVYFYRVALWKRVLVFLSSVPITILMNSVRIGVIGILVSYWGAEQAQGFMHFAEGWVVFMACTALLVLEMKLLALISRPPERLREVFSLDAPRHGTQGDVHAGAAGARPIYLVAAVVITATVLQARAMTHVAQTVVRQDFAEFPMDVAGWKGQRDVLGQAYMDTLRLDDYLLADFHKAGVGNVNLYVAYYGQQGAGTAIHSPRVCLPGGGWKSLHTALVRDLAGPGREPQLDAVETVIQKGEDKEVVYYWFQQAGRDLQSELGLRWYRLLDMIRTGRSDGALIRLTTAWGERETLADAEGRLRKFTQAVVPILGDYVPR